MKEVSAGSALSDDTARVMGYEVHGAVAIATMNRPDQRNAQNTALIEALDEVLVIAEHDDSVRVLVLAGAGDHWNSGHDLKGILDPAAGDRWRQLRDTPEGKLLHEQKMYVDPCMRLYHFKKPTVASIQGACIAAGLMWASMCDIIIAADDAYFSNPVLRMSAAGVELLVEPFELGFRKAKEFLLTGDKIDAQEAWRLGFVNKVVPRSDLELATMEMANRIALVPPITAEMVKASVNQAAAFGGKEDSWKHHFMVHHYTHNTNTSLSALDARQKRTSMKEVFADRDRGAPPSPSSLPESSSGDGPL